MSQENIIALLSVFSDSMMNMDMVVDLLRPELEVTKEDIEPFR